MTQGMFTSNYHRTFKKTCKAKSYLVDVFWNETEKVSQQSCGLSLIIVFAYFGDNLFLAVLGFFLTGNKAVLTLKFVAYGCCMI